VGYLWDELRRAIPLITHGNSYIVSVTWVTIRVAVISTAAALVVGLPIGLALGLGRFRGRRALQILANASLALPPVLVGVFVLVLLLPQGALGSLRIEFTLRAVYVAQAILALPYIVALTPAAIQGLAPGLLDQARALGAGRAQVAVLALREAKIGVLAAVIAAVGSTLAEVGAVVIVGGNIQNYDQTLASAVLQQVTDYTDYPYAIAIGIVLLALILVLIGSLTLLQQRTSGIQLRFRGAVG
jgi:tungstate transport system permease protein